MAARQPPQLPLRIAFSGEAGSGKSTATEYLLRAHTGFTELAFAGPLKETIQRLLDVEDKYLRDPAHKEEVIPHIGVSGRTLCQVIGTELFRVELMRQLPTLRLVGGTVWIHALLATLRRTPGPVVVSDCRFADEYAALKREGFTVVKIVRPSPQRRVTREVTAPSSAWSVGYWRHWVDAWRQWVSDRLQGWWRRDGPHASERGCPYDLVICNDGSLDDLERAVELVCAGLSSMNAATWV